MPTTFPLVRAARLAAGALALALLAAPSGAQSAPQRSATCALPQARERLTSGTPRRGTLNTKDCTSTQYGRTEYEDAYRFDLAAPTPIALVLASEFEGALSVRVYDAKQESLGGTFRRCVRSRAGTPECTFAGAFTDTLPAGTYYAVVSRYRYRSQAGAPARDLASYDLLLQPIACAPVADGALGIGETRTGTLVPGSCISKDARFERAHELVVTRQQDVTLSMRAGFPPRFVVRYPGSTTDVATSRMAELSNAEATVSLRLAPGTYHVLASSVEPLDTGRYELSVRYRGAEGEVANAAQCRPGAARERIAPGQAADAALTAESCWEAAVGGRRGAYYRLELPAAQLVELTLASSAFEPRLFLHDASGRALPYGMSTGAGSVSIRETLPAGTYYVFVTSRAAGATGAFRLEAKAGQ